MATDGAFNTRETWKIGSYCKVYSRSKKRWFIGKIDAIKGHKTREWLHVRYGEQNLFNHSKKIQRNCPDIEAIRNDHPVFIKKGSKCKIYSNANKEWLNGTVIEIFDDSEGEWLRVKYAVNNTFRTVEIQRFSEEIKLIPPDHKSEVSSTKQPQSTESKEEESDIPVALKSDSSYYLYKSTDTMEAENYRPIKIEQNMAENMENDKKRKGSKWNNGATMEQFDYSDWMKKRLETLLLDVTFGNSLIRISKVTKIEGSATVLLIRGKYRPGYDINIECKWSGYCRETDKKKSKGTLKMLDIAPDEDPDEWQYEVQIKNKTKANEAGMKIVKNDRESITGAINIFVKELYAKKS